MSKKNHPLSYFPFYCHQYMGMLAKYTYEEQGAFISIVCHSIDTDGEGFKPKENLSISEIKAIIKVYSAAVEFAKEISKTQKKRLFNATKRMESK